MKNPKRPRLFPVLLCAGVAAVALSACKSDEERLTEHLANAEAYAEAGKFPEALIELRSALQLDPQSAQTNYQIAQLLIDEERIADSLFYLRETFRLDPTRTDAALELAKYIEYGDPEQAEELTRQVMEREPDNPIAHLRLSELALLRNDLDGALAPALTAIQLAPNDPTFQVNLGIVHEARILETRYVEEKAPPDELFEAALAAFDRAIELSGEGDLYVRALFERARVFAAWPGHLDQAKQAYRELINWTIENGAQPQQVSAARATANFARAVRDRELEKWSLEVLVDADSAHLWAWRQLARFSDEAEPGSGEQVLRDMLVERPKVGAAHLAYARYLIRKGKSEQAFLHLEATIGKEIAPTYLLAALVTMHTKRQEFDKAEHALDRMVEAYPNDPETRLAVARRAVRDRRYGEAVEVLESLLETNESADAYHVLAIAELQRRNLPAATDAINRAKDLTPYYSAVLERTEAWIHHAARRWLPALRTLRGLISRRHRLAPDEKLMRARCLYAVGRGETGIKVLDRLVSQPEPSVDAVIFFARREGQNDPERARLLLENALERRPGHPRLLASLTRLDRQADPPRIANALDRLNQVIEAGQVPPAVMLQRAQLLVLEGRYDAAERDLLEVLRVAPNAQRAARMLVALYHEQGRVDEAIASFEQARQAGALAAPNQVLLASLHLQSGERGKARQILEEALAKGAELPGAKNDLAYLLADEGEDLDRAMALAQEARQSRANDASIADTLGYVYLKKGLTQAAVDQFAYAIELSERSEQPGAIYHYHHGLALQELGRNKQAADAFDAALALDPNHAESVEAKQELESVREQTGESGERS